MELITIDRPILKYFAEEIFANKGRKNKFRKNIFRK